MSVGQSSKVKRDGKVTKISTPSRFGSHSKMIVEEQPSSLSKNEVLLQDEFGTYITTRDRLDTGLADPRRYSTARVKLEVEKKKEE